MIRASVIRASCYFFILVSMVACATNFTNRIACTPGKDTGYFVSMYQWLGIAAIVDQRDSQIICASASIPAVVQNQPKDQRP
jgi:hypothetical protein